ncbi:MAG: host attachment protein [Alphaproteobacteria bacterium]|nr:host attachment protein [Alphaproteobacteria bacterium]
MRASSASATKIKPSALWVLVADGQQARFYCLRRVRRQRPGSGAGRGQLRHPVEVTETRLQPLPSLALTAEPLSFFQASRQKAHAPRESVPSFRHTTTPHGDIRQDIKQRFVRALAHQLEKADRAKSFDRLVFIAPPRVLGALRCLLHPALLKRLVVEIPEELTRHKDAALLARLKRFLPLD